MQKPYYFKNKGQLIAGTLHLPPGSKSCPGVVMLHGYSGQKSESHRLFVQMSRVLEKRGIASLRFDFRGSGESEGDFEDTTALEEVADARAALSEFRSMKRVDASNIGLLGMSLGGLVASLSAAEEPTLKSLVLWAAVARPAEVFSKALSKRGVKLLKATNRLDAGGFYVGKRFWETLVALDVKKALGRSKAPVFIVHGKADEAVPHVNSTDLLRAAKGRGIRAERLSIDGADHCFKSVEWSRLVTEATADWFAETLF